MAKFVVSSSALALVLAIPAVASAQSAPAEGGACPPGSWFCASAPTEPPPPAGRPVPGQLQPLPDPDAPPPPPPPPRVRRVPGVTYAPAPSQPPVVVYQPPPPVMVVRPETPPPYEYAPPPHLSRLNAGREWGLNLRLEGASIGGGSQHNAGMGGAGAGLRFKPNRYFGLETDLDFLGGHGYVGDQRHETALTFNALMYLNPRSRAQFYLLAGFGWSWANSKNDPNDPTTTPYSNDYSYFGGQAGIGLELRLTRVLALNVDLRGFVRSRTDQLAQSTPEFTNAQGQSTNTSGGALLTGGMTLYF